VLLLWLLAARRGDSTALVAAGALVAASVGVVLYTAYASWFALGKVCLYCTAMQAGNVALAFLVVPPAWRALRAGIAARPAARGLIVAAVVLAVALAGEAYARKDTAFRQLLALPPGKAMRIDVSDTLLLGDPTTPVSAVIFIDLQCPHCAECYRKATFLVETYPRCVHFRFKHNPLDVECNPTLPATVHATACRAARAGQAAQGLGLDTQALKVIFSYLDRGFSKHALEATGRELGVPPDQWLAAVESTRTRALVERDLKEVMALGFTRAPVAFVDGRPAEPAQLAETIGRKCGK
jgi:protein-disulfide isomerase